MKKLLIISMIFINACSSTPTKDIISSEKENINGEHYLDSLNENESFLLGAKYKALKGLDTLNCFSLYYQEEIRDKRQTISFTGYVLDVFKRGDGYIIFISDYDDTFAKLVVSNEMYDKIKDNIMPNKLNKGCFIVQVYDVSVNYPTLDSETKKYENDESVITEADSRVVLSLNVKTVIFKCVLIDFYLYKKRSQIS